MQRDSLRYVRMFTTKKRRPFPNEPAMVTEQLAWLLKSKHRAAIYKAVRRRATPLNGREVMDCAAGLYSSVDYQTQSSISNGRMAIKQLLNRGFLANEGTAKEMKLVIGPLVKILSDTLEEAGFPRMDGLYSVGILNGWNGR